MKKVNVSTKQIARFAGKWVVINPQENKIIAVGDDLKEIGHMVTHPVGDKQKVGESPYSFLVPRKDEGPYVLCLKLL